MPQFPQKKIQEALLLYLDCRSFSEVARKLDINRNTISKWANNYNWVAVAENVDAEVEATVATQKAEELAGIREMAADVLYRSLCMLRDKLGTHGGASNFTVTELTRMVDCMDRTYRGQTTAADEEWIVESATPEPAAKTED